MNRPAHLDEHSLDPVLTPARFEPLAVYSAERARGLLHSAGWMAGMARLQAEYDEWRGKQ